MAIAVGLYVGGWYLAVALGGGFTGSGVSACFVLPGAALLVFAVGLARSLRAFLVAAALVASWSLAATVAWMYAGCDGGMRSAVPMLSVLVWPVLLVTPVTGGTCVGIGVAAAWIVDRFAVARKLATPLLVVAALVSGFGAEPVAFAIFRALGAHPTPGACVI